jgi:predicted AAA+ superfamily ATPase
LFHRKLEKDLNKWRHLEDRKPLIIRGARQVGKTSLVHLFGENFEQYIYLNLEKPQDRYFFETHQDSTKLVQALFLSKGLESKSKETLIFIDEIQALPSAIAQLRYFYEDYPELYVIAAGSLLESVFDLSISFPVGRVQYLPLRPLSFEEFLVVTGEQQALQLIQEIPFPVYAQRHLLELFHIYTIIGGMPEIVAKYATSPLPR